MRKREELALMPRGKVRVPMGKSNLCAANHDLTVHGKWIANKSTGGLTRRCMKCAEDRQKEHRDRKKLKKEAKNGN